MIKKKSLYLYIFLFFFSIFLFFSNGHYGGDGLENYLTAESLVLDRDLSIHDRPFNVNEMSYVSRGKIDSSGKYYSPHNIGMPILLAPFYITGHLLSKAINNGADHDYITQFCVSLANPIINAFTALVLFIFLKHLRFSLKTCFLTTVCYGLCTMNLIYVRSGFSEPAIGIFILSAMLLLYKFEEKELIKYISLASFLVGYTLLIKNNSFLYLPLFLVYLLYKSKNKKSFGSLSKFLVVSLTPLLLCILVYFYISSLKGSCVNSIQKTDELVKEGIKHGSSIAKAIYYYIFSPGKSFFLYNLPLILALFGIGSLWERKKSFALYCLIFIFANIIFYIYRFERGSIFSWGPRYLYPIVPLFCIFLAEFIQNIKTKATKITFFFTAFLGFLIQLPCLFVSFTKYLMFIKEQLALPEYFINFMPELSPIRGVWFLFISSIHRIFFKLSLFFEYNPDPLFVPAIRKSLENYDIWDIWWISVSKFLPQIYPIMVICVVLLVLIAVLSFIRIRKLISEL
ncbi:MAG: hypothetical protein M0R48_08930 [Candidatus Omnitrophica bacterium]|jgi:hypothetical protein|nr:hypothetical protein [Candidatus Omnitrophota bacterium]